jgi:hypothetical protein
MAQLAGVEQAEERAVTLGCIVGLVPDTADAPWLQAITSWPAVVVLSTQVDGGTGQTISVVGAHPLVALTSFMPNPTVLDDSAGEVTVAQVTAAVATVKAAEDAVQQAVQTQVQAVAQAQEGLQGLYDQRDAFQADLSSDIAAVQAGGWDALTPQKRTDIILRILETGLGGAMQAQVDHLVVAGIVHP